jgi:hypothetical protein
MSDDWTEFVTLACLYLLDEMKKERDRETVIKIKNIYYILCSKYSIGDQRTKDMPVSNERRKINYETGRDKRVSRTL